MTRGLFGQPYNVYRRPGFLGRISQHIPAPLKAFGAVVGLAAATVVVAPAIIILAGPPLLMGAWMWRKKIRSLQRMANDLHSQRWQDMASFHIQPSFSRVSSTSPGTAERMPMFAHIAVDRAIEINMDKIASELGANASRRNYEFGKLQSLSQDFRLDPTGGTEKMTISEYPLFVNYHPEGIIRVIERGSDPHKWNKARIELQLRSRTIILNQTKNDEEIIEGTGHKIKPE